MTDGIPVATDEWRGMIRTHGFRVTIDDIRAHVIRTGAARSNPSLYGMAEQVASDAFQLATERTPTIVECEVEFERRENGEMVEVAYVFTMEASI